MTLSNSQGLALQNLADKQAGLVVGWIRINDAQALTDLGLAARRRSGWEITPAGAEMARSRGKPRTDAPPVVLRLLRRDAD